VGPGALAPWGGEKIAVLLTDVMKAKFAFFTKLNAQLEGFSIEPKDFMTDFDEGVLEARGALEGMEHLDVEIIFDFLSAKKNAVRLAGLEAALPVIKEQISLSKTSPPQASLVSGK
jgi:hypothetical protein